MLVLDYPIKVSTSMAKSLSLLALLALSHSLFAQLSEKSLAISHEPFIKAAAAAPEKSSYLHKVGVTVDPIRLLSGELPFSLQYGPFRWLVLEAGTGITYRNYFSNREASYKDIDHPESIDYKIHPMFMAGVKVFWNKYAFIDDFYAGLEYRRRVYGGSSSLESDGQVYPIERDYQLVDLGLVGGFQESFGKKMYVDLSFGLMLRTITTKTRYTGNQWPAPTQPADNVEEVPIPIMSFSTKVGMLLN